MPPISDLVCREPLNIISDPTVFSMVRGELTVFRNVALWVLLGAGGEYHQPAPGTLTKPCQVLLPKWAGTRRLVKRRLKSFLFLIIKIFIVSKRRLFIFGFLLHLLYYFLLKIFMSLITSPFFLNFYHF